MAKRAAKSDATTVGMLADYLDQFAPPKLAAEWDNVGLLLGDRDAEVRRVQTCLTVTSDVVAEAIDERAALIVTHHPILFRPIQRVTTQTPEGRALLELAQGGVAVYSPHTAFDNTVGGINDMLAQKLGLSGVSSLRTRGGIAQCKIVVFVPDNDLSSVSDALFTRRAGQIGEYRECGFRLEGAGTFFGGDSTNPTVGKKGRREEVKEWRLEVACPEANVDRALAAMRQAHSYEEPAYDVYPLRPTSAAIGEGRVGILKQRVSLSDFAKTVKRSLKAHSVQIVGSAERLVERVAIVCGAGGEFVTDAVAAKADVLLTGEARFHENLKAREHGLALVLPGHYATERFGVEELATRIQESFPKLHVWPSRAERDPLSPV